MSFDKKIMRGNKNTKVPIISEEKIIDGRWILFQKLHRFDGGPWKNDDLFGRARTITFSEYFSNFGKQGTKLNSLTSKYVPAGTKNSRSDGFLLAKHKDTNIPTTMEPFSPPAAWFWWTSIHHPREPTRKGLDEAFVEGF